MALSTLKHLSLMIPLYIFIFIPVLWAESIDELERHYVRGDFETPCDYFDSINITGNIKFDNGSYLGQGVVIPDNLIGAYNYEYDDSGTATAVAPHLRGCVCHVKDCINLCCPYGQIMDVNAEYFECIDIGEDFEWPRLIILTTEEGTDEEVDVFEQFGTIDWRGCDVVDILDPEEYPEDSYELFFDGSIIMVDEMYLTQNDYCMVPIKSEGTKYYLRPAVCTSIETIRTIKIVIAYLLLFSIPFVVLTIVVYLVIPELRTRHGKSLVCYLACIIPVNFAFAMNTLNSTAEAYSTGCLVFGYISYYFFLCAFFWLNVISFDLWHSFRTTRGISRDKETKRFIIYSLYGWGIPMLVLLVTWYIDEHVDMDVDFQPDFGRYCFINTETGWSGLIYFIAPMLIMCVANIIMFIMTAVKIHRVQREMARVMAKEDSNRSLTNQKDKFGLFIRLFLVMGVSWIMDAISYFVPEDSTWSKILYLSDIFNALQGFLIFVLFVMKRKVKQMIINRFPSIFKGSKQRQSENSMRTTWSSAGNSDIAAAKPLVTPKERVTTLS